MILFLMSIKGINDALASIKSTIALNSTEKETIIRVAGELGFKVPNCNCSDKYTQLVYKCRMFMRNRSSIPTYYWKDEVTQVVIVNGKAVTRYNYTDADVEEYIKQTPNQKEFAKKLVAPVNEENQQAEQVIEPTVKTATKAKKTAKSTKTKSTSK